MPQSLVKVIIRIICSTRNRTPLLKDADRRSEWFAYNATILRYQVDSPGILINGFGETASMSMNDRLGLTN